MAISFNRFKAINFKALEEVEINLEGEHIIIIGGENGVGKSAIIDAFWAAVGGKPSDTVPIKRGENEATVTVDLGDLLVERTFKVKKGAILNKRGNWDFKDITTEVVVRPAGSNPLANTEYGSPKPYSSPQEVLDKLTAKMGGDPEEFESASPADQVKLFVKALGLDFKPLDSQSDAVKEERKGVHTQQKQLEQRIKDLPAHADAPAEIVSVVELSAKLNEANVHNTGIATKRTAWNTLRDTATANEEAIAEQTKAIRILKAQLEVAEVKRADLEKKQQLHEVGIRSLTAELQTLTTIDTSEIAAKMQNVEADNQKVRDNKARAESQAEWAALEEKRVAHNLQLDEIAAQKQKAISDAISAAKLPVEGEVSYDEDEGLFINNIPFVQRSKAQRMSFSIALMLAQNPKLRWIPIRNGGNYDLKNRELLAQLAEEHNALIFMEIPSVVPSEVSIIIENGKIATKLEAVSGGAK